MVDLPLDSQRQCASFCLAFPGFSKKTQDWSLLTLAIVGNNTRLIEYLIKKGFADANKATDDSGMPLVFSVGLLEVEPKTIAALLRNGARVEADNSKPLRLISGMPDDCDKVKQQPTGFIGCMPNDLARHQKVRDQLRGKS